MIVFHTKGHSTKIQRQGRKNKHISCRMLGQLLTLIDIFHISQLSCVTQSRQGVTDVSKDFFGTCLNRMIIDRMRKTRRHSVVLACVVA